MIKQILIFFLWIILFSSCSSRSALDWDGCEMEEPEHIKAKRDSINALKELDTSDIN